MIEFKDGNNPTIVKQSIEERKKLNWSIFGFLPKQEFQTSNSTLLAYSVSEKLHWYLFVYHRAGRAPCTYQLWGKKFLFEPATTFIISRFFDGGVCPLCVNPS